MPKKGRPNGSTVKNCKRIQFYKKGAKERQRYLINNHSAVTAFFLAILSNHFNIIISYPIRVSFVTLIFPRIKSILLNEFEDIEFSDIIKQRLEIFKEEKNRNLEQIPVDSRINFINHYEIYHLLYDIIYIIDEVEIENEIEETSGLSGDYIIRYKEREYKWEDINEIGRKIINKIYGNRKNKERHRIIHQGELRYLLN